MKATRFIRFCTGILLLAVTAGATAARADRQLRIAIADTADWSSKKFKGETVYTVEPHAGQQVIRAESSSSASGFYQRLALSAREYPLVEWSWKISRTIAAENPFDKAGDDFAARVYLIFPAFFFWQYRAIVYVWSDKLPAGTVIASPYSDRVAVIAVESGNRFAGSWRQESRNYAADYRNYFHAEPADPVAVAFMTDTDNTNSRATAWYGDIIFRQQ